MHPTSNVPAGSHGTDKAPGKPTVDAPLSRTEPTSGPAGSTYEAFQQKTKDGIQAVLDSGKQAVDSDDRWTVTGDLASKAKHLGTETLGNIKALTTTQKAVGVGILAASIAFLLTRGSRRKGPRHHDEESEYRQRPHRSPFEDKKPRGRREDEFGPLRRSPWGNERYAGGPGPGREANPAGRPRVQGGSGPTPPPRGGQRRDQGPGRYDARTSGRQNPNNSSDLNSAF